ncbi:acetate kinase [Lyngbya sp. PCC 8106]|uniref:acetate kinase n=1 Tax=Lyngbya sp. (strain PCC 8106) TaxID=313612 RepID=UPI0000EA8C93|nr:acetate kinase [Lyngbya sp. PCC 8106]EAW36324.1 acetate/propionate kinase [Lyngbya sp. PCC 8106]
MKILVLNAGSSSQKSSLYNIEGNLLPQQHPEPIWEANIDWTASNDFGTLKVKANNTKQEITLDPNKRVEGISQMLETLTQGETQVIEQLSEIDVVGHRVVHGGSDYCEATRITSEVKAEIERLITLAPNHNPAHLEGIEAIEQVLADVPQVAVFDTAFHRKMPQSSAVYPIPYEWFEQGIRRYGFHGTSHKYCAQRAAQLLDKPLESLQLITCHLGNGCSLAAIRDGISVDTTMGFTPLEGLMMGTRSGSIDPAILIYLMRNQGFNAEQLDQLLNKKSGIKGITGKSGDMRYVLEQIKKGDEQANLAFEMFIHYLKRSIGSMLGNLTHLDALVFSAGIGEHSAPVREAACAGFEFLGFKIDVEKDAKSPIDTDIATEDSQVRVFVIHTEEDWAIASECWQMMQ